MTVYMHVMVIHINSFFSNSYLFYSKKRLSAHISINKQDSKHKLERQSQIVQSAIYSSDTIHVVTQVLTPAVLSHGSQLAIFSKNNL